MTVISNRSTHEYSVYISTTVIGPHAYLYSSGTQGQSNLKRQRDQFFSLTPIHTEMFINLVLLSSVPSEAQKTAASTG
jgi:hypothetical protein